jgi:hypothetical protein
MSEEGIIETEKYLEEFETKFGEMRKVTGSIGKCFDTKRKLFFDNEDTDKSVSSEKVYSSPNIDSLIVYFIVQSQDGHQLRDSRFKNIYGQDLGSMIEHYHKVLEPSVKHGLQVGKLTYVDCIGYGAIIEEKVVETISDTALIKDILDDETGLKFKIEVNSDKLDDKILHPSIENEEQPTISFVQISNNKLTLFAPKDKILEKPKEETGKEWDSYLKSVEWKDAMSLTIRETYYGILLTFDPKTTSFKVELNYPVEEDKLRKACAALSESKTID